MSEHNELSLVVHKETLKAWLVSDDGDEFNAKWIPKSEISNFEQTGMSDNLPLYTFFMPHWLALQKELI